MKHIQIDEAAQLAYELWAREQVEGGALFPAWVTNTIVGRWNTPSSFRMFTTNSANGAQWQSVDEWLADRGLHGE